MAVEEALQVVVLLPLFGSNPPTSSNTRWNLLHGASSRMLERWPRKVGYTGGSMAGGVAVLMAVSWSHAGGEESASRAPGVGGVSAWPEGSISKGYGTEEVIEFCVDFIPDLKPIGVPESRYEGRLRGKGTLGKKSATCMDGHSFTQPHYTVLHNSILVAPYKEEHKEILRSKYPEQREDWIDGEHMKTFGWLQTRLMNVTDDEQLYLLAKQPSSTISTFQGYEINGNTFYTFAQDKKSTNQNSGVRFDAEDGNGNKVTYYGYIEEIWELDYGPNFSVPLFRCKWFNLKDGVQVDPQYGMTTVDFKNLGYDTEPFVLASEVAQFFM
ncbi:hypothetical protein QYE76_039549 [Lolium multiflorum]|uniref:DUF4216 domain-containing protein n=1 Tax=Lolium multiflorum TaxID=4521 RepID=A0AAD8TBP0_LOLMU|nr:hypothetical protein QYE76_039549 [Lolium multiflorum]